MKKNDKGFSLVELIIVIAIMAILVGVVAPQLIKYIEKSKVSADLRSLEAIYDAVIYASNDPNVVLDPASQVLINSMNNPVTLDSLDGDTLLAREIKDTMDWTAINKSVYEPIFKSTHDTSNLTIYLQFKGGIMNPIAIWVTTTDITGNKDTTETPSDWQHIQHCICIK